MHDDAYIGGSSENNVNTSYMMISGGRTKQLDIFCRVTGFTSDFLGFIVVELIWFFHGAIHFLKYCTIDKLISGAACWVKCAVDQMRTTMISVRSIHGIS